jgi:hypothetical protein
LLGTQNKQNASRHHHFPPYSLFEIGTVFEEVLGEMLKGGQFEEIGETARFGIRLPARLDKAGARSVYLMIPLQHTLPTRKVDPASNFCLETIHAFFDNDLFMTTKMFLKAGAPLALCVTSSLDANRRICMAARGQTVRTDIKISHPITRVLRPVSE